MENSNELVLSKVNALNEKAQDKGEVIVALSIKSKVINYIENGKPKSFRKVSAYNYLEGFDIDTNESLGFHNYLLDVHFLQDLEINPNCPIKKYEDLRTGVLYVKIKHIQAPSVFKESYLFNEDGTPVLYEIKKGARKGEVVQAKEAPSMWLKGWEAFEAFTNNPSQFEYHKKEKIQDAQIFDSETGEIKD